MVESCRSAANPQQSMPVSTHRRCSPSASGETTATRRGRASSTDGPIRSYSQSLASAATAPEAIAVAKLTGTMASGTSPELVRWNEMIPYETRPAAVSATDTA